MDEKEDLKALKLTDIQFLESRLATLLSPIGIFTAIVNKLDAKDISILHTGITYYRKLVTNTADQYARIKPLIPHLEEILEKHKGQYPQTLLAVQAVKETLYQFELMGRTKEADGEIPDLLTFVKGPETLEKYDDTRCPLLASRLKQNIKFLAEQCILEFNALHIGEKILIQLNMTAPDRNSWTSQGPTTQIKVPSFAEKNDKNHLHRKPYQKTGTDD